jgi:hypothetical protein
MREDNVTQEQALSYLGLALLSQLFIQECGRLIVSPVPSLKTRQIAYSIVDHDTQSMHPNPLLPGDLLLFYRCIHLNITRRLLLLRRVSV